MTNKYKGELFSFLYLINSLIFLYTLGFFLFFFYFKNTAFHENQKFQEKLSCVMWNFVTNT